MSRLQKAISRVQRREPSRGIGFGSQSREQPRAALLGILAESGAAAKAALGAGVDVVIIRASNATGAAKEVKAAAGGPNGTAVGVWLAQVDDAGGSALAEAECDFVVGTLEGTAATAVDTERMGQVLALVADVDDTTLRSLAPFGLDGLVVEHGSGAMSLAIQLQLVRLASFASTPLLVTVTPDAPLAELRVLRDSGAACVLLPAGTSADGIKAMSDRLRALPPRKARKEGGDIALVPAMGTGGGHDEHVEDDPGEDE